MRVCLDACCLSRLSDDQSQDRVRHEAEALERIFRAVREGAVLGVCSASVVYEVESNRDEERRLLNVALLRFASETMHADDSIQARTDELARAA